MVEREGGVAALPTITPAGLKLLAEALEKNGWVSMAQALRFVEIEREAIDSRRTAGEVSAELQRPGAALLLARAEQELPGTIQRFAEGAKTFAGAVGVVAAFSGRHAIRFGKDLIVLAERPSRPTPTTK